MNCELHLRIQYQILGTTSRDNRTGGKINFQDKGNGNINNLKPTGHVTHHQFNIQQL